MRIFAFIFLFAFPLSATSIVSLSPVATEFLFALGLKDEIVGVTTYCDRPIEAQKITKVGGFSDPNLEAIIKLQPDLVVATPFGRTLEVVERLKKRGIKTVSTPVETLLQAQLFLSELGKALGKEQKAQEIQRSMDDGFAAFKNQVKTAPKVLILISASPLIAAGPTSFPGEILMQIGAVNVIQKNLAQWPVLSVEDLIHNAPEIIVLANGKKDMEATRTHLAPLLKKFPQIRFFAPRKEIIQRPGPYLNDEIEELISGLVKPNV